jgi:hypothetical protein
VKSPRIRLLGRVTGVPVYLVDGEKIRNETEIEFTSGGHGYVYPHFIPKGEIWIDDGIHGVIDLMATTYHEAVERDLMKDYEYSYDRAHGIASKLETAFRRRLAQAGRPRAFDGRQVDAQIRATCPHCS